MIQFYNALHAYPHELFQHQRSKLRVKSQMHCLHEWLEFLWVFSSRSIYLPFLPWESVMGAPWVFHPTRGDPKPMATFHRKQGSREALGPETVPVQASGLP